MAKFRLQEGPDFSTADELTQWLASLGTVSLEQRVQEKVTYLAIGLTTAAQNHRLDISNFTQ